MKNGIVNIHGKEYEIVASRINKFRKKNPLWSMETKIISIGDKAIVVEARISDEAGRFISNGHAEEFRNSSHINKTSALENAETSAWGRALANLGFGGDSVCSADELIYATKETSRRNKQEMVDGIINRTQVAFNAKKGPNSCETKINAHQNKLLQQELQKRDVDIAKFYSHYKIKFLNEMDSSDFNSAWKALSSKPVKQASQLSASAQNPSKETVYHKEEELKKYEEKTENAKKKLEVFKNKHSVPSNLKEENAND